MPSATSDALLKILDAAAVWNQTFLLVSLINGSPETHTKLLMITSAQDTKAWLNSKHMFTGWVAYCSPLLTDVSETLRAVWLIKFMQNR